MRVYGFSMGNGNIIIMKYLLILTLFPFVSFSQDAKTLVVHGDTLWFKNITQNDSLQLTKTGNSAQTLMNKTMGTGSVWNGDAIGDSYISSASAWNGKQAALSGTGFVKISGTTISYDNSTYLTTNGNGSSLTGLTASQVSLGNVTNESKATMFTSPTFTGTPVFPAGSISNASLANAAVANLSGTNSGDNATNSQYSGLVSNATHTGDATGATALTVVRINGTSLAGLGTGILKNTTGTGVPSIAVSGTDIKTINGTTLLGSGDIGVSGTSTATYLNLASNFSSTSVSEAAVTGWTFSVTSGKAYRVEVTALYQTAATTTGGELGFFLTASGAGTIAGSAEGAIVSTAAATSLSQQISAIGAADAAGSNLITTGVTAINSPHYIKSTVVFTCTVSGTFNVGWATEVAASAAQLNAGSALIYQVLN